MGRFEARTRDAYWLMHRGALALQRAEVRGMRVDLEYCRRTEKRLTLKIKRLMADFKKTELAHKWDGVYGAKTNYNSNTQLSRMLYREYKVKPSKVTATGNGATDEEALSSIDMPGIAELLKVRKLTKLRDTYLKAFVVEAVDGRIHPSFNLHLVRTFRSSSSEPNFQNIPKRDEEAQKIVRRALFPSEGFRLLEADYKGIEVVVAALYHKDPMMIKYLTDPDSDMHGDMAAQLFMVDDFDKHKPEHSYLRSATKNSFVFPQFYGDYYVNCTYNLAVRWGKLPQGRWKKGQGVLVSEGRHLSDHFIEHGIKSYSKFEQYVQDVEDDFWNRRFKVYNTWKKRQIRQYQKKGYVDMFTGFRCWGPMRRNEVFNYLVQGTAFHCLLWTFTEVDDLAQSEGWQSGWIGQIHDAGVSDTHPDEFDMVGRTIRTVGTEWLPNHWKWIDLPLEIEIEATEVDQSWFEKKEVAILPFEQDSK